MDALAQGVFKSVLWASALSPCASPITMVFMRAPGPSSPISFKHKAVLFPAAEMVLTDMPPEILQLIASMLLLVDVRATRLQRVARAFVEPVAHAVTSCQLAWWTGSGHPVSLPAAG